MSQSFDDMMHREFGEDFGDAPEMEAEVCELLERYALPPDGILHVLELIMELLRPLARLRMFADRCEADNVVRGGFRRELEALIVRQLTLLAQSEQ
jgi:hypothetical protein